MRNKGSYEERNEGLNRAERISERKQIGERLTKEKMNPSKRKEVNEELSISVGWIRPAIPPQRCLER